MELRPSAKIAIGVIAALGTIGALHLLVFQKNARQFQSAQSEYQRTLNDFRNQGNARNWNEIYEFQYTTFKRELEFWDSVQSLNVAFPDKYNPLNPETFDRAAQEQDYWDCYRYLQNARLEGQAGQGPAMSFLGGRPSQGNQPPGGWQLVDTLPPALIQAQIAVEDEITRLSNEDRLIKSIGANNPAYPARVEGYRRQLLRLGMDLNERERLAETYGSVVGTIYTINRIDIVMQALPDEFWNTPDIGQRRKQMYDLFQMEWPKDESGGEVMYYGYRQIRAMQDMLETAKKDRIEEIYRVIAHGKLDLFYVDPAEANKQPEQKQNQWDPNDGGFNDYPGNNPGGRSPKKDTKEPPIGGAMPIEMVFKANNADAMGYLYELANESAPYELDKLRLRQTNEEGKIFAYAWFNVVTFVTVNKLGKNKAGKDMLLLTENFIREKKDEARNELREIVVKTGAMDLAESDGYVTIENKRATIIEEAFQDDTDSAEAPATATPSN